MTLPVPKHVAIIMDGNGRWAVARRRGRTAGHIRGAKRVKEIVRAADKLGIQCLTLYGFSSENWSRPPAEVSLLMRLLAKYLQSETEELIAENVRVRIFGDRERFPKPVLESLDALVERSKDNTGLQLCFAFSYGGRQELTRAMRLVAEDVRAGRVQPEHVTEEMVTQYLYSREVPDPDLVIRTSGEQRISNFLLWQSAYSEFYFTPVMWPDFTAESLKAAVAEYQQRGRRFGGIQNKTPSSSERVAHE